MRIIRGVLGSALLALSLVSCGAPEEQDVDALGTVGQEVLTGTTDISAFWWGFDWGQAETDAIVTASGHKYVAYNNENGGWINYYETGASQYRVACHGASQMAYSQSNSGTSSWSASGLQLPAFNPPVGYALLWGDPAISVIPFTDRVFLASLAGPDDLWVTNSGTNCSGFKCCGLLPPGEPGYRTGGPNFPAVIDAVLAGACIARATAPGGFSLSASDCVRSGNDNYDGGSLAGSGVFMYGAWWNTTQGRMDVYRATSTGPWSLLAFPFPGKNIQGHPLLLASFSDGVFLIAREVGGAMWITHFPNGGSSWTTPVQVTTNCNAVGSLVTLKNGTQVRARGYTAIVALPSDVDFFCQTPTTTARTKLKGARCSGTPLVCNPLTGGTGSSNDSFMPVLGIAYNNQFAPLRRLTYWANNNLSGAQVRMRVWDYVNGTVGYAAPPDQTACPDLRGYWGDYDAIFATENGTSHPTLWRAITDSTGASCVRGQYRATPQHVSILPNTL
jgi:hypothetical protein